MALSAAISDLQVDDQRVRITRWRLPPGSETGHHRHEFDYAIVPIAGGLLTIADDAGLTSEFAMRAGESYSRRAGVEHNVMNHSGEEIVFVEVEIK